MSNFSFEKATLVQANKTSNFSFEKTLKAAFDAQNDLAPSTPQLDHALANSKEKGLPNIAVAPGAGKFLSLLCQLVNAKNVLEIGVLGGYSTIWLATSVPGVKVTSIEYSPQNHAIASENLKGLDNVELHLGAGLDVLPNIAEKGTLFDFVFIDADWENQTNYFEETVKMTRKGGIIFIDNALRAMTDPDYGGYDIVSKVKGDPRVDATIIPAMNTIKPTLDEAFDGFVMAIVK